MHIHNTHTYTYTYTYAYTDAYAHTHIHRHVRISFCLFAPILSYLAVSALFVTTASTETQNGTILGVTLFPPLPVHKVTPKIVPFSKKELKI